MDKRVIAQIAQRHGPRLLQQAVSRLAGDPIKRNEVPTPGGKPATPSIGERIAIVALLRIATKSVPGAILVSGGLIAKALHDRRKARRSATNLGKQR